MTILLSMLVVSLNGIVLRDVFHTLFAPTGAGEVSSFAARQMWRLFQRIGDHRPTARAVTGPLTLLGIIAFWALALALGWALIIWPHMPTGFAFASDSALPSANGFLNAFYISIVTLGTLGYGDIVPHAAWLRMIVPLEALIGFAMGTASVSWILSIYPVLSRRRHLARQVFLLERSARQEGLGLGDVVGHGGGGLVLGRVFKGVVALRNGTRTRTDERPMGSAGTTPAPAAIRNRASGQGPSNHGGRHPVAVAHRGAMA